MKLKAKIQVEFEDDGRHPNPKDILKAALQRVLDKVPDIIEYGISDSAVATGINRGGRTSTTKVQLIGEAEIMPVTIIGRR